VAEHESYGDVFVGTIPSLAGSLMGAGNVPLVRKRNLKLFKKIPGFHFFKFQVFSFFKSACG